jgi:hypothetical protein
MAVNEMYKKLGILAIAGMLLLGTGIGPVLAKMPGNFQPIQMY